MNIIELQTILKKLDINKTAREIAEIWGMDETSFSKKKKNGTEIKQKNIEQLEKELGIKLVKINTDIESSTEEKIAVDYYPDVFGSCGNGKFVLSTQKEVINVPKKLFQHFSSVKKYSVINAVGDSMSPTIYDKDKLIVEHWEGEQIKDNQVYVFAYNNEIFVKRLVKNVDEIVITSDNTSPIYRPRFIEKEDMNNVLIIGQIVGLFRELR